MRILFQTRKGTFSARGGDTVLVERFSEGLRALGAEVQIDTEGTVDPRGFDLVHLFNLMVRPETAEFARKNVDCGAPYVLTSLYEDWPRFFNQMVAHGLALEEYVNHGQKAEDWKVLGPLPLLVPESPGRENLFAAENAAAVLVSGREEGEIVLRDHPGCRAVVVHQFGSEVDAAPADPEKFRRQTGLSDYLICVGRIEYRKNQMMILKALEDSDLPLVFIANTFSYQPNYADAARRFRRRGKTLFIDHLPADMLASAYAGARAHVLPSWFELPGLVTLEAARYGTNVVVSNMGTIRDYIGDFGFYCDPADEHDIARAAEEAFSAPRRPGQAAHVAGFTWRRSAEKLLDIYRLILSGADPADHSIAEAVRSGVNKKAPRQRPLQFDPDFKAEPDQVCAPSSDPAQDYKTALSAIEAGNFDKARMLLSAVLASRPDHADAANDLGVLEFYRGDGQAALRLLRHAISLKPNDREVTINLSHALAAAGDFVEAYLQLFLTLNKLPGDPQLLARIADLARSLDDPGSAREYFQRASSAAPQDLELLFKSRFAAGGYFYEDQNVHQIAEAVMQRIVEAEKGGAK